MLHFNPLEIVELEHDGADAVVVTLGVPPELATEYTFVQGQHLAVRTHIGGEEVRRTYSICSGVDDESLRIAVKRVAGGAFSTWANDELKKGDTLDVMTPTGSFHTPLAADHRKLYAAYVAGSGITPVLSILRTTLSREPHSRFVLFYGNRETGSIMFREELEDLKNATMGRLSVHHFLSRQHRDLEIYNGRLDGERCRSICQSLLPAAAVDEFFLCGPSSMIDEVGAALIEQGADPANVHHERFTSGTPAARRPRPPVEKRESEAACRVTIILDGVRREFGMATDDYVLDAAADAGLDLPYSCKSGVCTTCRARLTAGRVELEANYGLEPHELEQGYVLTCQARPLTDTLNIDFDA